MRGDRNLGEHYPSVLHVWNTAGVACTLAKWTNRVYGVHTDVYAMKRYDPFGHITYGTPRLENDARFRYLVIQNIPDFDIVHLHEFDPLALKIRRCYPEKPLIMHYHGSDIRGQWNRKKRFWENADAVLVSTLNLLDGAPEEVIYFPNPIDTDLFHPTQDEAVSNSALTFRHGAVDVAEALADKHGLELSVLPRDIPFLEMPSLFRQFRWYIDTKRKDGMLLCRSGGSGSKTGLEALACGLKVINSDGEIREGLPSQHRAENAVRELHSIYMSLHHKDK